MKPPPGSEETRGRSSARVRPRPPGGARGAGGRLWRALLEPSADPPHLLSLQKRGPWRGWRVSLGLSPRHRRQGCNLSPIHTRGWGSAWTPTIPPAQRRPTRRPLSSGPLRPAAPSCPPTRRHSLGCDWGMDPEVPWFTLGSGHLAASFVNFGN